MQKLAAGLTALVSFTLLSAAPASADLNSTGTYTIDISCKGWNAGQKYSSKVPGVSLQITQTLTDMNYSFGTTPGPVPGNGLMMVDLGAPDNKGTASVVSCTINNDLDYSGSNYNWLGQITFAEKDGAVKVKGSYTAAASIAGSYVYTCKFKGERTSILDPGIPACAP